MGDLKASGYVTLAAGTGGTITGSVILGPGISPDRSSQRWIITGVVVETNRPGSPPIPRVQVVNQLGRTEGVSYDGSFDQGPANIVLNRSESITVTWTGGQAGDVATVTLSGTKS